MADCGGLMIGVESIDPNTPPLVMVKVPPVISSTVMSYDHRIIDGRESVGFLVAVKEAIDNPVEFLMNGDERRALEL